MKRRTKIGLVLVALVALGGAVASVLVFRDVATTGSGSIEQWIGGEIQSVANSYLNPRLTFADLDYTYPATVSLKQLKLTADDPAAPGKTIDILGCDHATLTLGEVPTIGKPIVIERIALDRPLFAAVAAAPGDQHRFVGFSDLVRGGIESTTQPGDDRRKLSDILQIRLIELDDGKIVYDPRIAGTVPLELDQITTRLDIAKSDASWHALKTKLSRGDLFDLQLAALVNIDNLMFKDLDLKLMADLGQEKLSYLPPQLQQLLKRFDVKGRLDLAIKGQASIAQPTRAQIATTVSISDANVTLGEYRVPVSKLELSAKLADGKLELSKLQIDALKGSASVTGWTLVETPGFDSQLALNVEGMRIEDLLAGATTRPQGEPPKLAGRVDVNADATAPLRSVIDRARSRPTTQPLPARWGGARVEMTDARLVEIHAIDRLRGAIASASRLIGRRQEAAPSAPLSEKVHLLCDFMGDQVHVTEMNYISDTVAATGSGSITLWQALDLTLKGGPADKLVGRKVGGALTWLSGSLATYHVTGTAKDPEINVIFAGGAVDQAGNAVEKGIRGIGKGLGEIGKGLGKFGRDD